MTSPGMASRLGHGTYPQGGRGGMRRASSRRTRGWRRRGASSADGRGSGGPGGGVPFQGVRTDRQERLAQHENRFDASGGPRVGGTVDRRRPGSGGRVTCLDVPGRLIHDRALMPRVAFTSRFRLDGTASHRTRVFLTRARTMGPAARDAVAGRAPSGPVRSPGPESGPMTYASAATTTSTWASPADAATRAVDRVGGWHHDGTGTDRRLWGMARIPGMGPDRGGERVASTRGTDVPGSGSSTEGRAVWKP